jgi:hypothetical protein
VTKRRLPQAGSEASNKGRMICTILNKKFIHVVPREGGWAVRREGAERASSVHETQTDAAAAARRIASREHGETFIHRPSGEIRDRDSYGNDPYPPRG